MSRNGTGQQKRKAENELDDGRSRSKRKAKEAGTKYGSWWTIRKSKVDEKLIQKYKKEVKQCREKRDPQGKITLQKVALEATPFLSEFDVDILVQATASFAKASIDKCGIWEFLHNDTVVLRALKNDSKNPFYLIGVEYKKEMESRSKEAKSGTDISRALITRACIAYENDDTKPFAGIAPLIGLHYKIVSYFASQKYPDDMGKRKEMIETVLGAKAIVIFTEMASGEAKEIWNSSLDPAVVEDDYSEPNEAHNMTQLEEEIQMQFEEEHAANNAKQNPTTGNQLKHLKSKRRVKLAERGRILAKLEVTQQDLAVVESEIDQISLEVAAAEKTDEVVGEFETMMEQFDQASAGRTYELFQVIKNYSAEDDYDLLFLFMNECLSV